MLNAPICMSYFMPCTLSLYQESVVTNDERLSLSLMVTPKKAISCDEYYQSLNRPFQLCDTYARFPHWEINISIRCDRWSTESSLKDPYFSKLCHGPFMLAKLHYDILIFTGSCLKIKINLSYNQFIHRLEKTIEGLELRDVFIIHLKLNEAGKMSVTVEEANSLSNYFEGLVVHKALLNARNYHDYMKETEGDAQDVPIPVYYDTEPTIPSFPTSFEVRNTMGPEIKEAKLMKLKQLIGETPGKLPTDSEIVPLMYNPTQLIMNAGDWVPAMFRRGRWLVPHVSSGGKNDALRLFSLISGTIHEAPIRITDFRNDEDISLISASRGIRRGVITGNRPKTAYKYTRSPRLKQSKAHKCEKEDELMELAAKTNIPNSSVFKLPLKN